MKKFWNFIRNDAGERILRLEGPIDEDNFWGDEVTPQMFREELEAEEGDVTVWINSPGGNVFATAAIYTMLMDYKGRITVKVDAIAASAASVIAMAGERVLMSPVSMLMIHDPMTIAMGNAKDMEQAISTLNEVKESIINAYHLKSGLSRKKISQLMEEETWMNAKKAVELGFADEILFTRNASKTEQEEKDDDKEVAAEWQPYSTKAMGQRVLNWIGSTAEAPAVADEESVKTNGTAADVESTEAGVNEQLDMFEEALPENHPETGSTYPDQAEGPVRETVPEQAEEPVRETAPEQAEGPVLETVPEQAEEPVSKTVPEQAEVTTKPVIGMDGKTRDGAMPFEILRKQLDFLK